ncbi:hypothetical protein H6W05_003559 [Salmonella enterica]|nr:hypothetical protein [Salmonella enterica]EKB5039437.1 hypothetical protein [Salmonella enterica]EME1065113.1 hypothetical protein [Salmonella enterica]
MAVEVKAVFRRVNGVLLAEVGVAVASLDFCSEEMREATMAAELLKARFATVTGFNNVNFINGECKYVS